MTLALPATDTARDEWLLARLFEPKPTAAGTKKGQLSKLRYWLYDGEEWRIERSRSVQFSLSLDDCAYLEKELRRRGLWLQYAETLIAATDDGEMGFVGATAKQRASAAVKVLAEG